MQGQGIRPTMSVVSRSDQSVLVSKDADHPDVTSMVGVVYTDGKSKSAGQGKDHG